jgi:alkylated DNA repair dioxygenase AlkB
LRAVAPLRSLREITMTALSNWLIPVMYFQFSIFNFQFEICNSSMLTLFPIENNYPEGFSYEEGFLTQEEEAYWIDAVKKVEVHTFQFQGYEAKRKVASFGYDYHFDKGSLEKGADIPKVFHPLIEKAAVRIGIEPASIAELLVIEYPPGAVMNWHRDAPPFGLIAGISLMTDCNFKLRPYEKEKQGRGSVITVPLKRRSLYVMQGASRSAWQHSIPAVKATRYSITLRTLANPE